MVHRRKHSRRHGRRHSRGHKRGGGSYSSAASFGEHVNGNTNAQYDRVFSTSGQYGNIPGNTIIGAQGQNSNFVGAPNQQQLELINQSLTGGRRSRRKRGGLLGSVVNQAVVPFTLLGMQQTYRRKKQGGKTHRRRHRR
jgi:hypothetical protein